MAAEQELTPPGDVALDPDRLAVWKLQHAPGTYFLVEGCGQSRSMVCPGSGACRIETR